MTSGGPEAEGRTFANRRPVKFEHSCDTQIPATILCFRCLGRLYDLSAVRRSEGVLDYNRR